MREMFDFIRTEMDLYSEICLKFELKNNAEPKIGNSFWPENFVFAQLRHFFCLKMSQF